MVSNTQQRLSLAHATTLAVLFVLLSAAATNAYTIVMRDGRRVEIPDKFTVTASTLTYEVSSGMQVTIQLAAVDIAATERSNGQAGGTLLRQVQVPLSQNRAKVGADQTRSSSRRSITNRDLETYKRARIESEIAYERRRKQLGLPSAEEQKRELAAIEERTQAQLLNMQADERVPETYWRNRAASLRSEIAVNDAQIDFVRGRLDEMPTTNSLGAYTTVFPFGNFSRRNVFFPPIVGPQFGAGVGVQSGLNSGQVLTSTRRLHGIRVGRPLTTFPTASVLGLPFDSRDYGFERTVLATQLNELLTTRAGLQARWRELEEEARRAGAYPGWLR